METIKLMAYALAFACVSLLAGCGTNDENAKNELQEETRANPGSQPMARGTEPNTPGHQAREGAELPVEGRVGGSEMLPSQTIVQNAQSNSNLVTFYSLIKSSGLLNNLNGTGPYTVFAPSNEAFEAMAEGTLEDLMKPENKQQLQNLISSHVVAGKLDAASLQEGSKLKTIGNQELEVTKQQNKVMVNGAEVTTPDVESSNGVIHVVNKVLEPAK